MALITWLRCIFLLSIIHIILSDNEYILYYESHRYQFTTDFHITINHNINISIQILPDNNHNNHFLSINNQPLIHDSHSDHEFTDSTSAVNTRRRLRTCRSEHCVGDVCHWHSHNCENIAPPQTNDYWARRYHREGRFIAVYPGYYKFNYAECSSFCRLHYGGLASIQSDNEQIQVNTACKDVLTNPQAIPADDYGGNWRGTSCFIGLQQPWKHWDDQHEVLYNNWLPAQPDNAGDAEGCAEIWALRGDNTGKWNDNRCAARNACVCQDAKGAMHGKYIAVQAQRRYTEAEQVCKDRYGTSLATITNDNENRQVLDACKKVLVKEGVGHCWIGIQRPYHRWNDGSDADAKYKNWAPGQPDNYRNTEGCAEILTEEQHDGTWNDVKCSAYRFFVCNAMSKMERMDFNDREELIAKRITRHRQRWERSQAEAYREKLSKAFFEQMAAQEAMVQKHQRHFQDKMRELLRQNTLNRLNPGTPYMPTMNTGTMGNMFGAKRMDGSQLKMTHNWHKRNLIRRRMMEKHDAIVYDDDDDEYKVPKKCVIASVAKEIYELCFGDNYVDIKQYMGRARKYVTGKLVHMNKTQQSGLEFVGFENWRKEQMMSVSESMDGDWVYYMNVFVIEYDYNADDKPQCWSDSVPYRLCMELDDDHMIISVEQQDAKDVSVKYKFGIDEQWNEIIKHLNEEEIQQSIEKCTKVYSVKLCVSKSVNNVYKIMVIRFI